MSSTAAPRGSARAPRRRRWGWWLLIAAFVVVPLVEIFTIISVGRVIGPWWTIALLILDSIIGGWLVKREGARAWRALREALASGRMPATELADAALILIAGTLMLTPGFVSDVLGIVMILPLTRPLFRIVLARLVARRLTVSVVGSSASGREPSASGRGPVVQGEVLGEE